MSRVLTAHNCRSCGGRPLHPVLDLGEQPLANGLRDPSETGEEARFPLAIVLCPACSLVQLSTTVPPEMLFDEYLYFSSYSTTMTSAMEALASSVVAERGLGASSLVVEAASNDGYLLQHYARIGVPVLGIEPARNIAATATAAGIPTLAQYFGAELADELVAAGKTADVFHANNVLAHVPDLNGFVAGIARILKPRGVAIIETPYVSELVAKTEFDTIYHEHVFYFSVTALVQLFRRHGLVIADIERLSIHGGSLRIFAEPMGVQGDVVRRLLAEESAALISKPAYYEGFAGRVADLGKRCLSLLSELRRSGHSIAAYGAAAKGAVLLNHFGIGADLLDFVVDSNEYKQGLVMPGVGIPVSAPSRLLTDQPDYTLLLAWNIADEVLQQQTEYRSRGGRFIVPIPDLKVV